MQKLKKPLSRLGRLFVKLQDLDHELVHKPGVSNHIPDLLSRNHATETVRANLIEMQSSINWSAEQSQDSDLSLLSRLIRDENDD
jgi:hypothetical protein